MKQDTSGPGFLKATCQGPQGSGKTYTAVELAAYTHSKFKCKKPVAFYDTETGSRYVRGRLKKLTGLEPFRVETRSFDNLLAVVGECVDAGIEILLVDSITHVWRELCDTFLAKLNSSRSAKLKRLDLDGIMQVKARWQPWPDLFLNSPLHIVVCGREGNEWGHELDEDTGKNQLVATGKKMKVETEFGFEASLQLAFEQDQKPGGRVKRRGGAKERVARRIDVLCTVIKDRFDEIHGRQFLNPTGKDFAPHIDLLRPGQHKAVDLDSKSEGAVEGADAPGFGGELRDRERWAEEVQGLLTSRYPGMSAAEKFAKSQILFYAFETRSWSRVEDLDAIKIRAGHAKIEELFKNPAKLRELTTAPKIEE